MVLVSRQDAISTRTLIRPVKVGFKSRYVMFREVPPHNPLDPLSGRPIVVPPVHRQRKLKFYLDHGHL